MTVALTALRGDTECSPMHLLESDDLNSVVITEMAFVADLQRAAAPAAWTLPWPMDSARTACADQVLPLCRLSQASPLAPLAAECVVGCTCATEPDASAVAAELVPRSIARARGLVEAGSDALPWRSVEPPTAVALQAAERMVRAGMAFLGREPGDVTPTVEGGLALCYRADPHYIVLECYNDGESALLAKVPSDGLVCWEITGRTTDRDHRSIRDTFGAIGSWLRT